MNLSADDLRLLVASCEVPEEVKDEELRDALEHVYPALEQQSN